MFIKGQIQVYKNVWDMIPLILQALYEVTITFPTFNTVLPSYLRRICYNTSIECLKSTKPNVYCFFPTHTYLFT